MLDELNGKLQNHLQEHIALLNLNSWASGWLIFLIMLAFTALVSLIAFYCFRKILLRIGRKLSRKSDVSFMHYAYKHGVFKRLSLLVPGFVVFIAMSLIDVTQSHIYLLITNGIASLAAVYIILISSGIVTAFLNCFESRYRYFEISKHYSIKSYLQFAKIILYSITAILVIATLLDKSPMYFLTGLGAMTAVLMLVFKDSILGFVASIQIATSDMVRIGDWVEMPNYGADGDIIDISLNTVKIQNFDKTIVTIPSYALLTSSVKNWRGMHESGGRRIKRAINIDINSVKFCDATMIDRVNNIPTLQTKINGLVERSEVRHHDAISNLMHIDEQCITNISLFRLYLEDYLRNHEGIQQNMLFLIRELNNTGHGIPIELYLFTKSTNWGVHETVQADIFDHIYAILPLFELKAFQYLTDAGNKP
tara:strand:+ start:1574 stop:2842 length:1269 start_codon:yes stop_codon:yes gene_type:complete